MLPAIKEESEDSFSDANSSNTSSSDSDLRQDSDLPKSKMSDKITLSVLTKFIKPYDGNRESLPAFITNCENAISLANTEQQNVLCKYILSQLEGKAQAACCLKTFQTWAEIKDFLKTTFAEKKHSTHLLLELQSCKQGYSETVIEYSIRVESCLTRILADVQYSCKNKTELPGRVAAMEDLALNTFLLGLNSSFSHIVRCRNPLILNEAITHAIEEEKLFNLNLSTSKAPKTCNICHKTGHSSSECFRNKKDRNERSYHLRPQSSYQPQHNNIQPHPSTSSQTRPIHNQPFPNPQRGPKTCNYCKNVGHSISECRKRQYNNNMRFNSANANSYQQTANRSQLQSATAPNMAAQAHFCEGESQEFNEDDQTLN